MEVSDLWFNDGTVIFKAGTNLFRLHSSFLSGVSPVIHKIFDSKNDDRLFGISRDIHVTGCLLITIPDDPQDAYHFFLSIYKLGFFEPPPMRVSIDVVLGVLRTSTKYEVQPLRRRALAHLNLMYPLTLTEWDQRPEHRLSPRNEAYTTFGFATTFEWSLSIAKIAREAHAPWLLPSALYECCQYDLDIILKYVLKDKSSTGQELGRMLILGSAAHAVATRNVLLFLTQPSADECEDPDTCLEVKRSFNETHGSILPTTDPLQIWDDSDWDGYLDGMCNACLSMCENSYQQARWSLWEGLPKMYDLPEGWSILKDLYQNEMFV